MKCILIFFAFIFCVVNISEQNLQEDIERELNNTNIGNGTLKSLSRKRRYLVFPEGSSFQIVYCLTYPSVGGGQIFVYGSTAALAWELPSEPIFLEKKKLLKGFKKEEPPPPPPPPPPPIHDHHEMPWDSWQPDDIGPPPDDTHRYTKFYSQGLTSGRKSFNAPFPVRPQKYNRWDAPRYQETPRRNFAYKKEPVSSYLHPVFHEIHRRTRRDLFVKIENLFTAMNQDGKACLLKAICEVSRAPNKKGSFMEEILKTIFRAKPHENYENEDMYDIASNKNHNCTEMYPTCKDSLWHNMLMTNK